MSTTIGEAIRMAATAAGWSATKIGAEVGTTEKAVIGWLCGRVEPRSRHLERLRRILPGLAEILDRRDAA